MSSSISLGQARSKRSEHENSQVAYGLEGKTACGYFTFLLHWNLASRQVSRIHTIQCIDSIHDIVLPFRRGWRQAYLPYGEVGATISILVQAGLSLGTDATYNRIHVRFQDFCVASPLSAIDYMIGLSLGEITFVVPALAVLLALLAVLGLIGLNLPVLLVVMLSRVGLVVGSGLFSLNLHTPEQERLSLTALVAMLLTVLPPVYYPIELIPQAFRWIAYLVPTTDFSILMQSTLAVRAFELGQLELSWGVLIAYTHIFPASCFLQGKMEAALIASAKSKMIYKLDE